MPRLIEICGNYINPESIESVTPDERFPAGHSSTITLTNGKEIHVKLPIKDLVYQIEIMTR